MISVSRRQRSEDCCFGLGYYLGESEIQNLRHSAAGDEYIGRLDVAVQDSFDGGTVQRICNLDTHIQHQFRRQRLSIDQMQECLAFQQLHGNKCLPINFSNLMNCADIGVIEGRRRSRLPTKPFQCDRVIGRFRRQELEGNQPAEHGVFGAINDAHSSAAYLFQDAVMAKGGARRKMRSLAGCFPTWRGLDCLYGSEDGSFDECVGFVVVR